jgi:hypothetical protein
MKMDECDNDAIQTCMFDNKTKIYSFICQSLTPLINAQATDTDQMFANISEGYISSS